MPFMDEDRKNNRRINQNALDKEVRQTLAFLFATSKSPQKRLQHYEVSLKFIKPDWSHKVTPNWLRNRHLRTWNSANHMDRYDLETIRSYYGVLVGALNKELVTYARFPIFETRLRQLRHYMDSQKPRGFRQLWKDNRDSLNYYTFWGVIIFGLLSVFLAFFSLAVSVAETVA